MQHGRLVPTIALVLVGVVSFRARAADDIADDPAQEAALLELVGSDFQIKRTPHFVVAHNADAAVVNSFVARIEQTYRTIYHFCQLNKIDARRPDKRLEIIFFAKREQYDEYARSIRFPSAGTYGVYYEPTNRSAFFNANTDPEMKEVQASIVAARQTVDQLQKMVAGVRDNRTRIVIRYQNGQTATLTRSEAEREIDKSRRQLKSLDAQRASYADRINRTVVQHEVTHQVFFNAGVHVRGARNPKWLVEGLACLFETPPDAKDASSGVFAINQLRLHEFRGVVADEDKKARLTAQDVLDAIDDNRFAAPRRLVSEPELFGERGDRGSAHYAMAWGLMHYLQRERPAQLAAYLKDVAQRKPGEAPASAQELALFEKHFGPLNDSFVRRWADYVLKLPVRAILPGQ
jgi:hypothetical protein